MDVHVLCINAFESNCVAGEGVNITIISLNLSGLLWEQPVLEVVTLPCRLC